MNDNNATNQQLDLLVAFQKRHYDVLSTTAPDRLGERNALWTSIAEKLNSVPHCQPRTMKRWRKTWQLLIHDMRHRVEKLKGCDKATARLVNDSWTPREREILSFHKYREKAVTCSRAVPEQDMLLIHYLDKFPEIRPFGDTTKFADTSNLKWISFTSILNTIGPRQSAHAWQSYVRNANDNISRDCDEEQIKQMSTLEHGIAQMRWPDIFGGYESFVQLPYFKTESKHDRRLMPIKNIQLQVDVIQLHLDKYPDMWNAAIEATNSSDATDATKSFSIQPPDDPAWTLLSDVLNVLGPSRTPLEWRQFVEQTMRNVQTTDSYQWEWHECRLADQFERRQQCRQSQPIAAAANVSIGAEIFRSDSGDLMYKCSLCNEEWDGIQRFRRHILREHGYRFANGVRRLSTDMDAPVAYAQSSNPLEPSMATPAAMSPSLHEVLVPGVPMMLIKSEPADDHEDYGNYCDDDGDRKPNVALKCERSDDVDCLAGGGDDAYGGVEHNALAGIANDNDGESRPQHSYDDYDMEPYGATVFECDICKLTYATKATITSHMRMHMPGKLKSEHECPRCGTWLSLKTDVAEHLERHNDETDLPCSSCHLKFVQIGDRNRHFTREHTHRIEAHLVSNFELVSMPKQNEWKCVSCRPCLVFQSASDLQLHRCAEHVDEPFSCDPISGHWLDSEQLSMRLETGNAVEHFRCNVCGLIARGRRKIREHMYKHSASKRYKCSCCSFTCDTTQALKFHFYREHGGGGAMRPLEQQQQQRQPQAESTAATATDATLGGVDAAAVMLEFPHGCETCGKRFRHRYAVVRHRRVHTGEKPFVCNAPGCLYAFAKKNGLRQHFLIEHSVGPDPYKCRWCDERFRSNSRRDSHVRRVHPEVRPNPKYCRKPVVLPLDAAEVPATT